MSPIGPLDPSTTSLELKFPDSMYAYQFCKWGILNRSALSIGASLEPVLTSTAAGDLEELAPRVLETLDHHLRDAVHELETEPRIFPAKLLDPLAVELDDP